MIASKSKSSVSNYIDPTKVFGAALLTTIFQKHNDPNRLQMSNNHLRQALPLYNADIPIIRSGYESTIAEYAVSFFRRTNAINKLSNVIYEVDNNLNFYSPFMKFEHNIFYDPLVIELIPQLIRKNEYKPELKYGKNALVAYMNYYGYVYQDGVVISESMSKKLSSLHLFQYNVKLPAEIEFKNINENEILPELMHEYEKLIVFDYIENYTRKRYELKIPKSTLIDVQIYILDNVTIKNPILVNYINKYYKPELQQKIHYIGSDDLIPTKQYPVTMRFVVATFKPATVGDKISNRHGNKGVISVVVPDSEMPKYNNKPIDVIYSTLSIPSRMNLGQLMESLLAKITKKVEYEYKHKYKYNKTDATNLLINYLKDTDKRLTMHKLYDILHSTDVYSLIDKYGLSIVQVPFHDLTPAEILELAKKYKVNEKEEVYIDGVKQHVNVGYQYIMKLEHTALSKFTGTTFEHTNVQSLGQKLGEMELWNIIAHDELDLAKELFTYRADNISKNIEYYCNYLDFEPIELPTYNIFELFMKTLDIPLKIV